MKKIIIIFFILILLISCSHKQETQDNLYFQLGVIIGMDIMSDMLFEKDMTTDPNIILLRVKEKLDAYDSRLKRKFKDL